MNYTYQCVAWKIFQKVYRAYDGSRGSVIFCDSEIFVVPPFWVHENFIHLCHLNDVVALEI